MSEVTYTIEELAAMTGLTRRKIRYYIHEGLLDAPVGQRRAAWYLPS